MEKKHNKKNAMKGREKDDQKRQVKLLIRKRVVDVNE